MHNADQLLTRIRELEAENAALRLDAGRYRWLRENPYGKGLTEKDGFGGRDLKGWDDLDAAIDAAMKGPK